GSSTSFVDSFKGSPGLLARLLANPLVDVLSTEAPRPVDLEGQQLVPPRHRVVGLVRNFKELRDILQGQNPVVGHPRPPPRPPYGCGWQAAPPYTADAG